MTPIAAAGALGLGGLTALEVLIAPLQLAATRSTCAAASRRSGRRSTTPRPPRAWEAALAAPEPLERPRATARCANSRASLARARAHAAARRVRGRGAQARARLLVPLPLPQLAARQAAARAQLGARVPERPLVGPLGDDGGPKPRGARGARARTCRSPERRARRPARRDGGRRRPRRAPRRSRASRASSLAPGRGRRRRKPLRCAVRSLASAGPHDALRALRRRSCGNRDRARRPTRGSASPRPLVAPDARPGGRRERARRGPRRGIADGARQGGTRAYVVEGACCCATSSRSLAISCSSGACPRRVLDYYVRRGLRPDYERNVIPRSSAAALASQVTYFLGDEAYVRALPGLGWWPTHDEAEWLGNLVGDVAWTIEPTFVCSPRASSSAPSRTTSRPRARRTCGPRAARARAAPSDAPRAVRARRPRAPAAA